MIENTPPSTPILEARQLVKKYKETEAVAGLSLAIPRGQCFGLLGPNGAGKTTTIEMMEGILAPTQGSIFFEGRPIDEHYRSRIGIQFQSTALPDFLTTFEVLKMFQSFYQQKYSIEKLTDQCSLGDFLTKQPAKLSGGQRQRVLLALALVNDPDIVFLDEPTTGLDPQARRNFWELIQSIKTLGKTVILTTHYMEEAQLLCDQIAIVDGGKIIAEGPPTKLLRQNFSGLKLQIPQSNLPADQEKFRAVVGQLAHAPLAYGDYWEWETASINQIVEVLIKNGVSLENMLTHVPTLEDLFLKLTGKKLRA